jgi:hypothetical protein
MTIGVVNMHIDEDKIDFSNNRQSHNMPWPSVVLNIFGFIIFLLGCVAIYYGFLIDGQIEALNNYYKNKPSGDDVFLLFGSSIYELYSIALFIIGLFLIIGSAFVCGFATLINHTVRTSRILEQRL